MDVSVIIVNYNTKSLTVDCIRSVYASETHYSYEVIVVDNASSDGSVEEIRNSLPDVRIIDNKENVGFGRANNQAAEVAAGRYLYILNSDTKIEKDVIETVVMYGDTHGKAGVIGTRSVFPNGETQINFYRSPTFISEFVFFAFRIIKSGKWFLFSLNKYKHYSLNEPFDVDVISGCSMFVKRAVYDEIGLFNENFFMYYEDAEFCYRVNKTELKCIYLPTVLIKHFHLGSAKEERKQFKPLIDSFDSACIYFTCVKNRWYAYLFRASNLITWSIELLLMRICAVIVRNDKLAKKITMLKTLLNEVKFHLKVHI